MKPCRLPAEGGHRLAGAAIDRSSPVSFTIDGQKVSGFAGDSVQSALMGCGFVALGSHLGHPMHLGAQSPFFVGPADRPNPPAMVAARVPIAEGMGLKSAGRIRCPRKWRLDWWKSQPAYGTLGQPIPSNLPNPVGLQAGLPVRRLEVDFAVVGGGIAGLSAAVFAAGAGQRTVLVEREMTLGGMGRFFARVEGEPDPAEAVDRLLGQARNLENLTIITRADIDRITMGRIAGLAIDIDDPVAPVLERLEILARHIVLATGAHERAPLFSGNRLAGVVPSIFAWRQARDYGVWYGQNAQFFTSTNSSYRLATQVADAGIQVGRIADARLDPQSRLIAFAKAYGMRMMFATKVTAVWANEELREELCVQWGAGTDSFGADSFGTEISGSHVLIVGGGLQPNIRLWALAGGQVHWDSATGRILARQGPDWLAVAGSANGLATLPGVMADGQGAVRTLLGDRQARPEEREIDLLYESVDGPLPASVPVPADGVPGYFDAGRALKTLPQSRERRRFMDRLLWKTDEVEAEIPRFEPPTIVEVAAQATLGNMTPEEVQMAATERVIEVRELRQLAQEDAEREQEDAERNQVVGPSEPVSAARESLPPYLFNRFGRSPVRVRVIADDGRRFETGRLIFANSEETAPEKAIGVVVGALDGAAIGIFAGTQNPSAKVSVADTGGRTPATLLGLPE